MRISELKEAVTRLGVPESMYSIMKGELPNEKLCIVKNEDWEVYYSERGNKTGLKTFRDEDTACRFFLEMIKCL